MNSTFTKLIVGTTTGLVLLSAAPALAQERAPRPFVRAGATTSQQRTGPAAEDRIAKVKERAHQEIQRRISAMQELTTRVQAMARVSDASKSSISSTLQAQISNLTALDVKIVADTDIETIKTDIKSITGGYRIFALVMPQGRMLAAADRFKSISANLTTLAGKLSTRIAAAQTAGKDVATLSTTLADIQDKIADITIQTDTSIALVSGLTPDNGDKVKQDANKKAVDDARAKLKTAETDAKAARKDAGTIVDGLKAFHLGATASTTSAIQ